MTDRPQSTTALVLTHNAPASLERCLAAIGDQARLPDAVIVVDNASQPPVDGIEPLGGHVPVQVVRSAINTGPAGGYAQALAEFLQSEATHAWVLDDDMRPDPCCLERLWRVAAKDPSTAFVFPVSRQSDGSVNVWPSWCGFVLAREIVEDVGLPMAELFWWAEDTEYLQWRIPEAGYQQQVVHDAIVDHDAIRRRGAVPLWKYYYEARNMLYVHLHVKHKVGRYPRNITLLFARAMVREHHGRLRRLSVMARGLMDGARGRLGIRYPVEPLQERTSSRH
jgi:rhamnopyranosyl-N-acetylglucosaminyl-diphospho-decaprenol beta-1,3/1,4-galactofuranosyltransferase